MISENKICLNNDQMYIFMHLQCRENMLLLFTPLDIFKLMKSKRFLNNIWHMRLKLADMCVWSAHYLIVSVCERESDMKRPERLKLKQFQHWHPLLTAVSYWLRFHYQWLDTTQKSIRREKFHPHLFSTWQIL